MKDAEILSELEKVSDKIGISVRYAELTTNGGYCKTEKEKMIIVNKDLNLNEKIKVIASSLAKFNINNLYIIPIVRDKIEEAKKDAKNLIK